MVVGPRRRFVSRTAMLLGFSSFPCDLFSHEHGLISITAYWMTVIHIPFTLFNVTATGLGYYMILEFSLYPS